jgi:hypothetical protein
MKKVLLLLAVVLVGCTAEETAAKKEVAKDCKCNRVAAVSSINIIGDARGNMTGSTSYYYRTINDCTLLQSDWISNGSASVKVGDCK